MANAMLANSAEEVHKKGDLYHSPQFGQQKLETIGAMGNIDGALSAKARVKNETSGRPSLGH